MSIGISQKSENRTILKMVLGYSWTCIQRSVSQMQARSQSMLLVDHSQYQASVYLCRYCVCISVFVKSKNWWMNKENAIYMFMWRHTHTYMCAYIYMAE
jgi:hypothetical protein